MHLESFFFFYNDNNSDLKGTCPSIKLNTKTKVYGTFLKRTVFAFCLIKRRQIVFIFQINTESKILTEK